ncbi:hypothetical protein SAMN02745823_01214 [Sporobacter termitidis DSM 10068]|uniref:Uncharacterized protein n=1 Tax=Sporobacter termitidis DSM 10068 TaxID=1123282 RepID=A0A1M5WDP6_9FIRM|nr:hypothetical protein [Sporobacter termitidis]SHH85625.1 hypothetical protein SAMN02745823_01214 [Sporobacter termitidis DSM 10068]
MIKLIEIVHDSFANIETSYIDEIKTFNIVTNFMDDNCKAYEIGIGAMLWVNDNSIMGELECIYPPIVQNDQCTLAKDIRSVTGIPKLKVIDNKADVYLQLSESGCIIWFKMESNINLQVNTNNAEFLFSDEQLAAIKIIS